MGIGRKEQGPRFKEKRRTNWSGEGGGSTKKMEGGVREKGRGVATGLSVKGE